MVDLKRVVLVKETEIERLIVHTIVIQLDADICARELSATLRWFNVVMGERMSLDEHSTDKAMARVPLPEPVSRRLTMRLGLKDAEPTA